MEINLVWNHLEQDLFHTKTTQTSAEEMCKPTGNQARVVVVILMKESSLFPGLYPGVQI